MKIRLIDNGFSKHSALFKKTVRNRIPLTEADDGLRIELRLDKNLGAEAYNIIFDDGVTVSGGSELGLYYGIGKLLHSAVWKDDGFIPVKSDGIISPACPFRAIYFAVHFYNWYQMADENALRDYLEDLLLWGYNTVICVLPIVNCESVSDPLMTRSTEKMKMLFSAAREYNMKTGTIFCVNQGFKSAPHVLDAEISYDLTFRGCLGRNLCPSKPEAIEYMCNLFTDCFTPFKDIGLDYIITWPYDEGGCGCKECLPWGGNGYIKGILGLKDTITRLFPNITIIPSTWAFDMPDDYGDYRGFYKRLEDDLDQTEYIMVDSHGDFPQYVLDHPVKPGILNFPEISMNGLFPWGGFGANPMPKHFQGLWDSAKHLLKGGLPYSEGIFEDISKIQCVGYYWHPNKSYREILSEYINYEFSPSVTDKVLEILEGIEENHFLAAKYIEPDYALAERVSTLIREADAVLPEKARRNWRWRILYIRARLDEKRYLAYRDNNIKDTENGPLRLIRLSGDFIVKDEEAQAMLKELRTYYCTVEFNGENHHTLPPLGGTVGVTV